MDDFGSVAMPVHEGDTSACELEFFHEKAEVLVLIASMCKESVTEIEFDVLGDTLNKKLLKYLEQSQLVRPHVCDLLVPLNERLSITIDNHTLVSPQVHVDIHTIVTILALRIIIVYSQLFPRKSRMSAKSSIYCAGWLDTST